MSEENTDQYMKPHGVEGIQVIESMNEEHQEISEFAFECVDFNENANILDIGCGGGVNIEKFLKATKGNVDGLDYSDVSVRESIKRNQDSVDSGRCNVIQANVANMPIEDESYDLATAFSTIFFWPDLGESFKEVFRILKPNGQFMMANGIDGTNPADEELADNIEGINLHTPDELEEYLLEAGFKSVEMFKKDNTFISVIIAKK